jgi:hypothetical protein
MCYDEKARDRVRSCYCFRSHLNSSWHHRLIQTKGFEHFALVATTASRGAGETCVFSWGVEGIARFFSFFRGRDDSRVRQCEVVSLPPWARVAMNALPNDDVEVCASDASSGNQHVPIASFRKTSVMSGQASAFCEYISW